jgi:hypothetical protein
MSSITIDYIVYCREFDRYTTFVVVSDRLRRSSVIVFLQKTWFLWWILATLVILRWFHLFSSRTDDEGAFEAAESREEQAAAIGKAA